MTIPSAQTRPKSRVDAVVNDEIEEIEDDTDDDNAPLSNPSMTDEVDNDFTSGSGDRCKPSESVKRRCTILTLAILIRLTRIGYQH